MHVPNSLVMTSDAIYYLQKLLGVDTEKLAEALTSTSTTTRGSVIKRRLKDHQAIGETHVELFRKGLDQAILAYCQVPIFTSECFRGLPICLILTHGIKLPRVYVGT